MKTKDWIPKVVVTFFGLGYSPKAPGTVGSLGALLLWGGLFYIWPTLWVAPLCLMASFIFSLVCIPPYLKQTHRKDPQEIVIDEAIGVFIMLAMVPPTPFYIGLGFVLFRILDIWKPWPISAIDTFGGNRRQDTISIMGDDAVAGSLAGGLTWAMDMILV